MSLINKLYRKGPDLYFYKRIFFLRKKTSDICSFLKSKYNREILYATLVSWDMNSRGAKMKSFEEFSSNLFSCSNEFERIEDIEKSHNFDFEILRPQLIDTYEKLNVMRTQAQLVSNSKLLHFLFPDFLLPMDRKNTRVYFYGYTNESINKYLEIIELSFDMMNKIPDLNNYIGDGWNTSVPKLIDNAIILKVGTSTSKNKISDLEK